ncbi:conserved phage C-terminal domain-containing protein [Limosilactobacillus portuensis]|jgi:uncharacterized phage protein (TIGR02220 family)|uniref:Conserved phage C-terminal domain-containing protein n=1 Tax=Limosilactobacillus portuensis TaxID=2742601 RepID=A0ABS6IVP8_9LACO|nr:MULTISPECIES: conserved phage C-terminal domain-containing protein [Limosilactobacillus]MBU9695586.1 conserved phage C-terminal domain-containing protein [Limosilactobacillus portuensis]
MPKRKVKNVNRAFNGVWIPKKYWLDENLSIVEVTFMAEIESLDGDNGCYASNNHFAEFFGMTASRVSQIINSLSDRGYLQISYEKNGKQVVSRLIRVVNKLNGGIKKTKSPIKKTKGGYLENCEGNNTPRVIQENNTDKSNKGSAQPPHLSAQRKEVIDYLNKKTGKRFKPNADGNKRVIDPRLKDGYTVDDLKHIIDVKYAQWHGKTFSNGQLGDNYLRPETLFRVSKIEGYLNEEIPKHKSKEPTPDWFNQEEPKPVKKADPRIQHGYVMPDDSMEPIPK